MAEINPPLYLDQDAAYGADELGLPYRDIMGEGIVGAGDLAVTNGGSLKSSVAAGAAWVTGDDNAAAQPCYRVRNDAAVLLQHDAADATYARIDLVIAEVLDATFSGVSKLWRLRAVKGTPASSPVAPALPSNAIPLAEVTIPAGSGTLGTITDRRSRAKVGAGAAQVAGGLTVITAASGLPASPSNGQQVIARIGSAPYTFLLMTYDGTYGKWVSEPLSYFTSLGASALVSGRADYITTNGPIVSKAGDIVAAGFVMQVRHAALVTLAAASSATSRALWRKVLDGQGAVAYGADTAAVASNSVCATDGDWEAVTGLTAGFHAQLGVSVNLTAGSGSFQGVQHYARFVSP